MEELVTEILRRTTVKGQQVNIVVNPDGFLRREDTRNEIELQSGVKVLPCSQLELRIIFETDCKDHPKTVWLFVVDSIDTLLPDIRLHSYQSVFYMKDMFVTYYNQGLNLKLLNYKTALQLFRNKPIGRLNKEGTRLSVKEAQEEYGENGNNILIIKRNLSSEQIDWYKPKDTIENVSEYIIKAAKQGLYEEIENELAVINNSFQKDIDERYFSQMLSATRPKVVHKILPYMLRTYGVEDKVALVVVDGMAYWQYMLLRDVLDNIGIETHDDVTYSWLPSITMLSRQAIFRGDKPRRDYRQNPKNERNLWLSFWFAHGYNDISTKYVYSKEEEELFMDDSLTKLAYVTVTLDEYMHSAANMKQLFRDTEDWAKEFAPVIKSVYDSGFEIIITADHGSVPSHAWGNLTSQEKTYLYEDGSRGKRHSIYTQPFAVEAFCNKHMDIEDSLLVHNNFICWRDNRCFGNKDCITHGGSNMLEMVVPFITIKKKVKWKQR